MGIKFWILISLYLWHGTWVKNLCEQIPCQRECHMAEPHVLPHEISVFIYIFFTIVHQNHNNKLNLLKLILANHNSYNL